MCRAPSSSLKTLNFSSISFVLSLNPLRKIPVGNENSPVSSCCPSLHMQPQKRVQIRFLFYSIKVFPHIRHVSLPRFCARLGSRSVFAAGFVGAV